MCTVELTDQQCAPHIYMTGQQGHVCCIMESPDADACVGPFGGQYGGAGVPAACVIRLMAAPNA